MTEASKVEQQAPTSALSVYSFLLLNVDDEQLF